MPVPSAITDLSTTAASNYPQGGEAVGPLLDDYLRSIQAIIRSESQSKTWETWNDTPTYVSATQFTVAGNLTSRYTVNRIIRVTVSGTNYYGAITASAFTTLTTVTVALVSGSLTAGLTAVALGPDLQGAALTLAGGDVVSLNVRGGLNYAAAGGTVDAITATIGGATSYTDGMIARIQAAGANTSATPTLNVNSIGAKTIVKLNGQPLIAGDIPGADFAAQLHYDSSLDKWVLENPASCDQLQSISASVAANALTVGLNPVPLSFRSTTLTSGVPVARTFTSALSLTVPSGATLGTVNAQLSRIVLLAIDNAGTVELAVVNISGGNQLDETNLISTTAISGTSNSANVIYSQTARTNVAYRVVGVVDSTQATAGTWASAPSLVQPAGGQAVAAMASMGYGQTYQDVTASRTVGTTYYNTTGRPIHLYIKMDGTASTYGSITVNGVTLVGLASPSGTTASAQAIVPPGGSYSAVNNVSITINKWIELR